MLFLTLSSLHSILITFQENNHFFHLILFQSIQRSYSWMKYYNSEIESNKRGNIDEKVLRELLDDVKKSIEKSIIKINDFKYD